MDFRISNNKYRVFAELARQGSSTERHLMKDKLREHKEPFSWFMQTFVDLNPQVWFRSDLLSVG